MDDDGIANDAFFTPTQTSVGQQLRVSVSYTDQEGNANINALTSDPTSVVGNFVNFNGGAQTVNAVSAEPATEGDDIIATGLGADTIVALGGNDTIEGGSNVDNIDAGDGDDLILYTVGDGSDTIVGGAGVDTLDIIGLVGNDTLTVAYDGVNLTRVGIGTGSISGVEQVTADLQTGTNTLVYNGATLASVTVNLASGEASGFTSIANIQNVTGGAGNDLITGGVGSNNLQGGLGNDTLDGGAGNDTMLGGGGNDTFIVDSTGDMVGENGGGGIDTTLSSVTRSLFNANLEHLVLTGGANINGTGNNNANQITGNTGNNTLTGGVGNDTLDGGAGNDILNGGLGVDSMTGGAGDDTFDFNALAHSLAGSNDVITDFQGAGAVGGDVIDLFDIDAINGGANNAFAFIGGGAFTAAGQVRAVVVGTDTIIQANTNGNLGTVEFELRLSGVHPLNASDFIL